MRYYNKLLFNVIALVVVLVIFYYCLLSKSEFKYRYAWFGFKNSANSTDLQTSIVKQLANEPINVWCIFTKVTENAPLQNKFQNLIKSLFKYTSQSLHLHIICDNLSKVIAKKVLDGHINGSSVYANYSFYDVTASASLIDDIVQTMMPYFSSQPGTYYSDALFYLSLGLHRIAPLSQKRAIMLDCDTKFSNDISLLYKEFSRFEQTTLFGLSYELSPVYRHVLYSYKTQHKTTFGEYYHVNPISKEGNHPYGFPGYNSGVTLFNLSAIRKSKTYLKVISKYYVEHVTKKYKFKGHLGDQDFYTLLGYEYPELFVTLPCYFNRQLCVWWRDHGYGNVFGNYAKCNGSAIIYHGNCNSPIPA